MKDYLGDGVYAEYDGFGIWLTSENGIEILDKIYLEPSVIASLNSFFKRAIEEKKERENLA